MQKKRNPVHIVLPLVLVLLAAGLAGLSLAGCSTVPKSVLQMEPADALEQMPEVYVRIDKTALKDLVAGLSDEALASLMNNLGNSADTTAANNSDNSNNVLDRKSLDDLLNRTTVLGLGLSGIHSDSQKAEAVLVGNFPVFSMQVALATNGGWTKTSEGYKAKENAFYIRPLEQGIVHAANFPLAVESKTSKTSQKTKPTPLGEVVPSRFKNPPSDLLVVVKSPEILFNFASFADEPASVPISQIVLQCKKSNLGVSKASLSPDKGSTGQGDYVVNAYIVMKDATTAKIFKPAVKLIWAFSAQQYLNGATGSDTSLTLDNDTYKAEGMILSTSSLADLFVQLTTGFAKAQ
jgi:hypothetical protein